MVRLSDLQACYAAVNYKHHPKALCKASEMVRQSLCQYCHHHHHHHYQYFINRLANLNHTENQEKIQFVG